MDWRESESPLFHIGMIIVCIGYLFGWLDIKQKEGSYAYMLVMRLVSALGHLLVMIWAATENETSSVLWSVGFFAVHLLYSIDVWAKTKPILLGRAVNTLWENMFGPAGYNLPLDEFYELIKERAVVMTVHAGDDYPGLVLDQEPENLSILISGELEVLRNRDWSPNDTHGNTVLKQQDQLQPQPIATVVPFEFIDSYEYFARGLGTSGATAHRSQVVVRATQESAVLRWSYTALEDIYLTNPRLHSCMQAMLGQDLIKKFLRMAGRRYVGYDDTSDMVRQLDKPFSCFREAGVIDPEEKPVTIEPDEGEIVTLAAPPAFAEIVNSLRYANARMLAVRCTPLESLAPVPTSEDRSMIASKVDTSNHMNKLISFLKRAVDVDTDDARNIVKWGKWHTIRKQYTDFLRAGERPHSLGIIIQGQIDVLTEVSETENRWESSIQENELLGAIDFQEKKRKSKFTYKVRSHGAIIFTWDSDRLRGLMKSDPRLATVVSKLLRDDYSLKLQDNQPGGIRWCGGSVPRPNETRPRGCF